MVVVYIDWRDDALIFRSVAVKTNFPIGQDKLVVRKRFPTQIDNQMSEREFIYVQRAYEPGHLSTQQLFLILDGPIFPPSVHISGIATDSDNVLTHIVIVQPLKNRPSKVLSCTLTFFYAFWVQ